MNECAVGAAPARTYPYGTVRVGIADRFAESGPYADLLDRYGMSVNDIVAAAKRALARKAGAVIAADWETA